MCVGVCVTPQERASQLGPQDTYRRPADAPTELLVLPIFAAMPPEQQMKVRTRARICVCVCVCHAPTTLQAREQRWQRGARMHGQPRRESHVCDDLHTQVFEPAPPGVRKAILATNIAETSITISGVGEPCLTCAHPTDHDPTSRTLYL